MNDPYHWHAELMVKHEMAQVDQAVKQAHLLREAGLTRPSLLSRVVKALRSLLQARGEEVQGRRARRLEQESCQAAGDD